MSEINLTWVDPVTNVHEGGYFYSGDVFCKKCGPPGKEAGAKADPDPADQLGVVGNEYQDTSPWGDVPKLSVDTANEGEYHNCGICGTVSFKAI